MARTRLLKPEFFRSEDLSSISYSGRLLFAGLWTLADKDGRLHDRPRRIAADLFPYDLDADVDGNLDALAKRKLIIRYSVGETRCIQITGFAKHQTPHPKEPSLGLPSPEEAGALSYTVGQSPGLSGQVETRNVRFPSSVSGSGSGSLALSFPVLGSEPEPPGKPAPSPVPNLFTSTLSAFGAIWASNFKAAYCVTPADKSQLGRMLRELDKATVMELPELFQRYAEDPDHFLVNQGHSLKFFCTSGGVNKYRAVRPKTRPLATQRRIDAGLEWQRAEEARENATTGQVSISTDNDGAIRSVRGQGTIAGTIRPLLVGVGGPDRG